MKDIQSLIDQHKRALHALSVKVSTLDMCRELGGNLRLHLQGVVEARRYVKYTFDCIKEVSYAK